MDLLTLDVVALAVSGRLSHASVDIGGLWVLVVRYALAHGQAEHLMTDIGLVGLGLGCGEAGACAAAHGQAEPGWCGAELCVAPRGTEWSGVTCGLSDVRRPVSRVHRIPRACVEWCGM